MKVKATAAVWFTDLGWQEERGDGRLDYWQMRQKVHITLNFLVISGSAPHDPTKQRLKMFLSKSEIFR